MCESCLGSVDDHEIKKGTATVWGERVNARGTDGRDLPKERIVMYGEITPRVIERETKPGNRM